MQSGLIYLQFEAFVWQGMQAMPSQQILSENMWSTGTTSQAQQAQPSAFATGNESGQPGKIASSSALSASFGAQLEKGSEIGSASLGILTKDAEMQARYLAFLSRQQTSHLLISQAVNRCQHLHSRDDLVAGGKQTVTLKASD